MSSEHTPETPRFVIPAQAGIQIGVSAVSRWIPAFAGMTK